MKRTTLAILNHDCPCFHTRLHAAGLLLAANKGNQTLGIIDPAAGSQLAAVPEDGVTGHEVIASPDGKRAFVPIYGNAGVGKAGTDGSLIRVIDIAARQITDTIDFGKGVRPHCPMIGPKNGLLYVTTEWTGPSRYRSRNLENCGRDSHRPA